MHRESLIIYTFQWGKKGFQTEIILPYPKPYYFKHTFSFILNSLYEYDIFRYLTV